VLELKIFPLFLCWYFGKQNILYLHYTFCFGYFNMIKNIALGKVCLLKVVWNLIDSVRGQGETRGEEREAVREAAGGGKGGR
jgi:hypothetical protein